MAKKKEVKPDVVVEPIDMSDFIKSKKIEIIDVHSVVMNPDNANEHSDEQIEELARIIRYQGFRVPITISNRTGFLIAGHGRLMALKLLGVERVPAIFQDFENEAQEYAHLVADNEIARKAELNLQKVYTKIKDMPDLNLSMLGMGEGFKIPEPEIIDPQNRDEDSVPGMKAEPKTKKGDVFLLGEHRLMCGDSTMIDDIEKLINNNKIDFIHTDPPYGIDESGDRTMNGTARSRLAKGCDLPDFQDDSTSYAMDAFALAEAFEIPLQVWWGANYYCHALTETNNWLVWDKRVEENQSDFNSDCELAWVKSKQNSVRIFRHLWKGMIKASEHGESRVHPTQKPVELIKHCFERYDKDAKAKNVLDLFGGSGSTLIACVSTERKCFMMELSPYYCDVIIKRFQQFTGLKAKLETTGELYDELK